MRIVGINAGLDARMSRIDCGGCAVIEDGRILGAVAEERATRKKHDGGYRGALNLLLDRLGLELGDIDYFYLSCYGSPFAPPRRLIEHHLADLQLIDRPERLVIVPSHHLSHAYSAFFLSPFDEALLVVADNEGNLLLPKDAEELATSGTFCERNSYYWGRRNQIFLLERDFEGPDEMGFGKVYNRFTRYLGLGSYFDAGKTMGLSAYASVPERMSGVDLWSIDPKGRLSANMISHHRNEDLSDFFRAHGIEVPPPGGKEAWREREYRELAAYVQQQLDKWMVAKVRVLVERSGIGNVCFSGGVALNAVTNSKVERELGVRVFAPPFPSDGGQALGNAIYGWIEQSGKDHHSALAPVRFDGAVYLGTEYGSEEIERAIELELGSGARISRPERIEVEVAELIAGGAVVGFFGGRSEYGERALGNRSVVADPRRPMRELINLLKGREEFRPLAPAVLAEEAARWFENTDSALLRFMIGVAKVRPEKRRELPAITHADGSARVQTVSMRDNPRFYRLIEAFQTRTGVPIVLNTSFNHAGEPMVETPQDAIRSALAMRLDAIALGDVLVRLRAPEERPPPVKT